MGRKFKNIDCKSHLGVNYRNYSWYPKPRPPEFGQRSTGPCFNRGCDFTLPSLRYTAVSVYLGRINYRGLYVLLDLSNRNFKTAHGTFRNSRCFIEHACLIRRGKKIAWFWLAKRGNWTWEKRSGQRSICTYMDSNASILLATACSHSNPCMCTCFGDCKKIIERKLRK